MSRDVGVGQLVEELEQRGDRLPFEIGAFVALEACEGLLQESVKLEPDDVRVTIEGAVEVADSAPPAAPDEAARSLVSVLGRLLVAAGPGVPPYLLQLVEESAVEQDARDLRALHDAIEASLIPINRGASRRVLARLVRESDRPPAPEAPQVEAHELDAELDELLRDPILRSLEAEQASLPLEQPEEEEEPITERIRIPRHVRPSEPSPSKVGSAEEAAVSPKSFPPPISDAQQPETLPVPPSEPALRRASRPLPDLASPAVPAAALAAAPKPSPEPVTATIRKWQPEDAPSLQTEPGALQSRPEPLPASPMISLTDTEPPPPPEPARESRTTGAPEPLEERPSLPQPPTIRRGGWGIWLLAAVFGAGVALVFTTDALSPLLDRAPAAPSLALGGVVEVTVAPEGAQVFTFVGRGPASAADLALEGPHEFVVFDRGLSPSRGVVPAEAKWASSDSGPLYELAVQARPLEAGQDVPTELGEVLTAGAGSSGPRGTVRIVTNPPDAKVYRFVGFGPRVEIPVSSIHEGQEVLVALPGHALRREVVGPSDWKAGPDGTQRATVGVSLSASAKSADAETVED